MHRPKSRFFRQDVGRCWNGDKAENDEDGDKTGQNANANPAQDFTPIRLLEPVFDFFFGARLVAFFAMPQISVFWTAYRVQQREPRVEVMKNSPISG